MRPSIVEPRKSAVVFPLHCGQTVSNANRASRGARNRKGRISIATQELHTYCAMCTSRCGVLATVEDGLLTKVNADAAHPNECAWLVSSVVKTTLPPPSFSPSVLDPTNNPQTFPGSPDFSPAHTATDRRPEVSALLRTPAAPRRAKTS